MNLKQRLSLYLSIAFAALLGLSLLFIYYSFSSFRSQEFASHLKEEALSDVALFSKIQNADKQLLKTIDNNSLHKLHHEKTLIFDARQRLMYSSVADALVNYNPADLNLLKSESSFFRESNGQELFGLAVSIQAKRYYVLIAAEDIYGLSKLQFLAYTLLVVFGAGCLLVGGIVYFIVVQSLRPLAIFGQKIKDITINEVNTQLPEIQREDEVNLLIKSFNQMLQRIENGYVAQRAFTAHASHELRTPISRLSLQLDNLMQQPQPENTQNYLKSMHSDVQQLGDLVQSLTTLTQVHGKNFQNDFKKTSIDEVIFAAYKVVKKQFADFQMEFNIIENENFVPNLNVLSQHSLLEVAFINLFKNAYLYADNRKVIVQIERASPDLPLQILLTNSGAPLVASQNTTESIFESFVRGSNAQHISGSGLGLSIVKRILECHHATISYAQLPPNLHQFSVQF